MSCTAIFPLIQMETMKEAIALEERAYQMLRGAIWLKLIVEKPCPITESHGIKIQTKIAPRSPKVWKLYLE